MKALLPLVMMLVISLGWAADVPTLADDPTRPPEGVVGADGTLQGNGTVGLTSVMLPRKGGRAAAVIDGQVVPLGGTVRDAKLVSITEGSVVLESGSGKERLFLTPEVEKKTSVTKAAQRRQKE